MRSWKQIGLLSLCVVILLASTPGKPAWQMKADYIEACSCHLFCPCYFNKHAEHPHCEFNMAVKGGEGNLSGTKLAWAKDLVAGGLGGGGGTKKKRSGGGRSFRPLPPQKTRYWPA